MPDINEHIVVIGGGYAGALSAIQLKLAGYKQVTILEKGNEIFCGASIAAYRLHSGGEYPQDEQTGQDCLRGAVAFKQMFAGEKIFTDVDPVNFLVAGETEREGKVTVEKFIAYYRRLMDSYENYCRRYQEEHRAETGEMLPLEAIYDRLLGWPNNGQTGIDDKLQDQPKFFYRELSAEECAYVSGAAGGFQSNEIGILPVAMAGVIKDAIMRLGIDVRTQHAVADVKQENGRFTVMMEEMQEDGTHTIKTITADQVVNAAWQGAFKLNHQVAPEVSPDEKVNVFLRGMLLVDIKEAPEAQKMPPTFVMDGSNGGMFCRINDGLAAVYLPGDEGAYLGAATLKADSPEIPSDWEKWMKEGFPDSKARQQTILSNLQNLYPFLQGAKPIGLQMHPTLSYDSELKQRRDAGVQEIVSGFYSVIPTKATYAAEASRRVTQKVLKQSVCQGKISQEEAEKHLGCELIGPLPVKLPDGQSIGEFLAMAREAEREAAEKKKLADQAKNMGLPEAMTEGIPKSSSPRSPSIPKRERSGSAGSPGMQSMPLSGSPRSFDTMPKNSSSYSLTDSSGNLSPEMPAIQASSPLAQGTFIEGDRASVDSAPDSPELPWAQRVARTPVEQVSSRILNMGSWSSLANNQSGGGVNAKT